METETRERGLAGRARGRALGDSVSGRRVAAAKVPTAYPRVMVRSVNAGAHRASAQRAILVGSAAIKNPHIPLKSLALFFSESRYSAIQPETCRPQEGRQCRPAYRRQVLGSARKRDSRMPGARRITNHCSLTTHF
jgi:hypothetical protein